MVSIDSKRQQDLPPSALPVVKKIGEFIQYWGFKRIHGEIWAQIFLSSVPLDAKSLAARLRVSKGLMSLAIKDLLHYRVIRPCSKGPKRTIYYEHNPEIMKIIVHVLQNREKVLLDQISEACQKLQSTEFNTLGNLNPLRARELGDLVESAQSFLDLMIAEELAPALSDPRSEPIAKSQSPSPRQGSSKAGNKS
ncbi:MAG: hypothetical protein WCH11_05200 [Bdellovibrio sp.]